MKHFLKKLCAVALCLAMLSFVGMDIAKADAAITIDGIRTAFFSPEGAYLPPIEEDGQVYVPAASLGESLGLSIETDAAALAVKAEGVRVAMFDKNGAYLPPKNVDGILYVPLEAFCESLSISLVRTGDSYALTRAGTMAEMPQPTEVTPASTEAPARAEYYWIDLTTSNFSTYFNWTVEETNFSYYTKKINYTSFHFWSLDLALKVTALTGYEFRNVALEVTCKPTDSYFNSTGKYYGASTVSMPRQVIPQNGQLTRTETSTGVYIGYSGPSHSRINPWYSSTLTSVSGQIRLPRGDVEPRYHQAIRYRDEDNYSRAISEFEWLMKIGFEGAEEQLEATKAEQQRATAEAEEKKKAEAYQAGLTALEQGDYDAAISCFTTLKDYLDSASKLAEAQEAKEKQDYQTALTALEQGDYDTAINVFLGLKDYKDSPEKLAEAQNAKNAADYQAALIALEKGDYDAAINGFAALTDYRDSREKQQEAEEKKNAEAYEAAAAALKKGDYDTAVIGFTSLKDYRDSAVKAVTAKEKKNTAAYQAAKQAMSNGDYDAAVNGFKALGSYQDSADMALLAEATGLIKDEGRQGYVKTITLLENHLDSTKLKALYEESRFRAAFAVEAPSPAGVVRIEPYKSTRQPYLYYLMDAGGKVLTDDLNSTEISYYDEAGKLITSKKYHQQYDSSAKDALYFVGNHALTYYRGKPVLVDKQGNETALPDKYTYIDLASETLICFRDKNGYGCVDLSGKVVIKGQYDNRFRFQSGYAKVDKRTKKKLQYGVINEKGRIVVEFGKYDSIGILGNDLFLVTKKDAKGNAVRTIINAKGQVVKKAGTFNSPIQVVGNYLAIPDDGGQYGLYDYSFNQVLPNKYTYMKQVVGDRCVVAGKKKADVLGQYGDFQLYDLQGKLLSTHIYDMIYAEPDSPYIAAKDQADGCWYLLDLQGKVIY